MNNQGFSPESIPDEFWEFIAVARQDYQRFRRLVKQMNRSKLIRFCWDFEDAAAQFKDDPYINVLLSVRETLSEDTLDDICNWIMTQGNQYYTQVFYNPELTPTDIDEFEPALGILGKVIGEYDERYDEPIPINPKYVVAGFYGYQDFTPDQFWKLIDLAHEGTQ